MKELATIQKKMEEDQYSGVLYMSVGGEPVLWMARGDRIRIDTQFNLGSASKMFTAVGFAQWTQREQWRFGASLG